MSTVGSGVPVLISLDSTVSNRGTELSQLNLVTVSEGDSTIGVILAGIRAGIGLNLIAVERGQLGSDNFLGCQSNSVEALAVTIASAPLVPFTVAARVLSNLTAVPLT